MNTTLTPLGRELDNSELEGFHGAAACTVFIIIDARTGQIMGVVPVGDCAVEHRFS